MITIVSSNIHEILVNLDQARLTKIPTPGEMLCFKGIVPRFLKIPVTILITGSGESRSLVALNWLNENIKSEYIVHVGFSDSTKDSATPGHIIISSAIGNLFGYPIDWDLSNINFNHNIDENLYRISKISCLNGNLDFHLGKSISVSNKFRTNRLRTWINTRKDIVSIDDTGFFIGNYAKENNIPFLSITSVINYVHDNKKNFIKGLDYSPEENLEHKLKFFPELISSHDFKKRLNVSRLKLNKFINLFGSEFSNQILRTDSSI